MENSAKIEKPENEIGNLDRKRPADDSTFDSDKPFKKRWRAGEGAIFHRLLIPSKWAGAIIGKGGVMINKLRDEFECQLSVPDAQGPERVIRFACSQKENEGPLFEKICHLLRDDQAERGKAEAGDDCELRMLVHQSRAGAIIGFKGQTIKELREQTGAKLNVFQEVCPHSTDRMCTVKGQPDVVRSCLVKILNVLETVPPRGPTQDYDPDAFDPSYEYGGYSTGPARFGSGGGGGRGGGYVSFATTNTIIERQGNFHFSGRGGGGRGGGRGNSRGRGGPRGGGPRGGGFGGPPPNNYHGGGPPPNNYNSGPWPNHGGGYGGPPPGGHRGGFGGGDQGGYGGNQGGYGGNQGGYGGPPPGGHRGGYRGGGGGAWGNGNPSTRFAVPPRGGFGNSRGIHGGNRGRGGSRGRGGHHQGEHF